MEVEDGSQVSPKNLGDRRKPETLHQLVTLCVAVTKECRKSLEASAELKDEPVGLYAGRQLTRWMADLEFVRHRRRLNDPEEASGE